MPIDPPNQAPICCPRCGLSYGGSATTGLCPRCLIESLLPGSSLGVPPHPADPDFATSEVTSAPSRSPSFRIFGDFEIVREIARGGMGVVYEARHRSLGRTVALKVMSGGWLASADQVERFRREASASARLDHPNIVPIYDIGEEDGCAFFTMRLIRGGSFSEALQRDGDPDHSSHQDHERSRLQQTVTRMSKVARAVHYAHQRGILHRDIKPNNILIDDAGEPYLTDFGLAKILEGESEVTRSIAVLGTPSYMAPEQARGEARQLTTAADVYGLGAVLYETLTGRPPFVGESPMDILRQVLQSDPAPPSSLNPQVDGDLETICLKCLEKLPASRYRSAEELAEELDRWLRQEPIHARPTTGFERVRKWVRREPLRAAWIGTIALALISIAVVLGVMNLRLSAAKKIIADKAEQDRRTLISLSVSNGERAWSAHDGFEALLWWVSALKREEQTPAGESREGSQLTDLHRLEAHRWRIRLALHLLPKLVHRWSPGSAAGALATSSDGHLLAYGLQDGSLQLAQWPVSETTKQPEPLQHDSEVEQVAFSPDGSHLAAISKGHRFYLWDLSTHRLIGSPIELTPVTRDERTTPLRNTGFSPDSSRVWITVGKEVRILNSATGQPVIAPLVHRARVNHAEFSPDAESLIAGTEDGELKIWDLEAKQERVVIHRKLAARVVKFSPDGQLFAIINDGFGIEIYDTTTGVCLATPTVHRDMIFGMCFSSDSKRFISWSYDNTARIWDARTATPITPPLRHRGPVTEAMFLQKDQVVMSAGADGTVRFWNALTGEPTSTLLRHPGPLKGVVQVPDGRLLATTSREGGVRLWELPGEFDAWRVVHRLGPVNTVQFHPDGHRVLIGDLSGRARVWDLATDTPASRELVHGNSVLDASFSPDGGRFITGCKDGRLRLWNTEDPHHPLWIAEAPGMVTSARFSPSGDTVLGGTLNGYFGIWDAKSGEPIVPAVKKFADYAGAVFSRDGRMISLRGTNGLVWLLQPDDLTPIRPPIQFPGHVQSVSFHPHKQELLVSVQPKNGDPAFVQAWDLAKDQAASPRLSSPGRNPASGYSPSGDLILIFAESSAQLWSAKTWTRVGTPIVHEGWIHSANFSIDGRWVFTASADETVRFWDVYDGRPVGPPLPHGSRTVRAVMRKDGEVLLTATSSGKALAWRTDPFPYDTLSLESLAEELAAHRINSILPEEPLRDPSVK